MDKRITSYYLIGTFLITYIMWGILIFVSQYNYLKFGTPISMVLYIIGGNAPPIMAYIVLKKENKITGIKQLSKEAFAIKQKPRYYALIIVFLVLYFGVPFLMQGVTNGIKLYISFLYIPLMILLGGLEELGWRYILQRQFERKFPFGVATIFTGVIWALWHLPLFFIIGTPQSNLSFGLFTIIIFGMSFALATIYYVSRSIWLCILFHSMINALSSSWIIEDSIEIKIVTTISMIIFSFVIVFYHKQKKQVQSKEQ